MDVVVTVAQILVTDEGAQEGRAALVVARYRGAPGCDQIEAPRRVASCCPKVDLEGLDPTCVQCHIVDVQPAYEAAIDVVQQDREVSTADVEPGLCEVGAWRQQAQQVAAVAVVADDRAALVGLDDVGVVALAPDHPVRTAAHQELVITVIAVQLVVLVGRATAIQQVIACAAIQGIGACLAAEVVCTRTAK